MLEMRNLLDDLPSLEEASFVMPQRTHTLEQIDAKIENPDLATLVDDEMAEHYGNMVFHLITEFTLRNLYLICDWPHSLISTLGGSI